MILSIVVGQDWRLRAGLKVRQSCLLLTVLPRMWEPYTRRYAVPETASPSLHANDLRDRKQKGRETNPTAFPTIV